MTKFSQETALVQRGEDTYVSMLPQLIDTFITSAGQQIENIVCAAASHDFEKWQTRRTH